MLSRCSFRKKASKTFNINTLKHMTITILFCIVLFPLFSRAQSIPEARINRIKTRTVKIFVDGIDLSSSGFYISSSGEVLTCWHTIEPAFHFDSASCKMTLGKIYVQTYPELQKIEYSIPLNFYQKLNASAVANDYCVLTPVKPLVIPVPFFQMGNYDKVLEGQEILSCGYPNGSNLPMINKGIVSSKYIDSSAFMLLNSIKKPVYRELSLADITMNIGQSGGPILLAGSNEEEFVIGIANFLLSPLGRSLEILQTNYGGDKNRDSDDALKVQLSNSITLFSDLFNNMTTGISTFTSIKPFLTDISTINK